MTGTLITPTSASTAPALSARRASSIEAWSAMKPKYRNSRMSSEVSRASQTHHVPQVGRPQSEPVQSATKVNSAPVGAIALAIMPDSRVLSTSPSAAQNAMTTYRNIDIQAAGTWMKMMRYASPCCASVGATKKPRYSPTAQATTASAPKPAASRRASGKKVCGEEYLYQFTAVPVRGTPYWMTSAIRLFRRNPQSHRGRPRRKGAGRHQERREQQELGLPAQAG